MRLVKGLVSTILTIMDAMILLAILSYIGALICSEVLGKKDPEATFDRLFRKVYPAVHT